MPVIKKIPVIILFLLSGLFGKTAAGQPGSLISFNVKPGINHSVLIEWNIEQQTIAPHFELERSNDQKVWEKIADMPIQSSQLYSFTDNSPREGLNYYRVWKTDGNKGFAFTMVKWVQVNKTGILYIWPNPAKDMLYIKTPFVKGRIDIINSGGKLIINIPITGLITNVPTNLLSKGIYFIHVRHDNEVLIEKFMRE